MRLCLEYGDHNESFAKILPRTGAAERTIRSRTLTKWVLFHLDTPVEYEGRTYEYFLLRSRWLGLDIGASEPTSVFILLVTDVNKARNGFRLKDFEHVAWGLVRTLRS